MFTLTGVGGVVDGVVDLGQSNDFAAALFNFDCGSTGYARVIGCMS
jgi:hypothetical protein